MAYPTTLHLLSWSGLYYKDYNNDDCMYPIKISAPTVQVAFIDFSYSEGDEEQKKIKMLWRKCWSWQELLPAKEIKRYTIKRTRIPREVKRVLFLG